MSKAETKTNRKTGQKGRKKKESTKVGQEIIIDDVKPDQERFELLLSDEYELTRSIPIHVQRYPNGEVVVSSMELDLYAQGEGENDALQEFSIVLIEELEDLESFVAEGRKLSRKLEIELSLLKRLLRRIK